MEPTDTFQQKKLEVGQLLESATSLARDVGRNDVEERLRETAERFATEQLYVVVCGEFKQGKSRFINAFLEEPGLCPVDTLVTTSLVSSISYADEERIVVYLEESKGEKAQPKEIGREEIEDYVSEQRNEGNKLNAKLLTIEIPNERLRSGLVLIDTPGVGGEYREHSDVTYRFIPNADVVLFLTDALKPLSDPELEFVGKVAEYCKSLIFVVTKRDKARSLEELLDDNREKLSRVLERPADSISITAVSSLHKEDYLESHDPEDLEDSNFTAFERELWQLLGEQRGQVVLVSALDKLAYSLAEARAPLQAEWEVYQGRSEKELEEIKHQLDAADKRSKELTSSNKAQWQQDLREGLQEIGNAMLKRSFEDEKDKVYTRFRDYLKDDDLLEQPPKVADKVAEDLNLMMSKMGQEIVERVNELRRSLEESSKLGLSPFQQENLFEEIVPPSSFPEPKKRSRFGKVLEVARKAGWDTTAASAVGGLIGGAVGVAVGALSAGLLVPATAPLGWLIGQAVFSPMGTYKGIRTALEDMKEKDHKEKKKAIEEILKPFIDKETKRLKADLEDVLGKNLEKSMRADLQERFSQERDTVNRSIRHFKEALENQRKGIAPDLAPLRASMKRFDQLQAQIQLQTRRIYEPPDQGTTDFGSFADE